MNQINESASKIKKPTRNYQKKVKNTSNPYLHNNDHFESAKDIKKVREPGFYKSGFNKISQLEDQTVETAQDVISSVRARPLISVLVVAGLGYLISKIYWKKQG